MTYMTYFSWKKSVMKGVKYCVLYGLPLLVGKLAEFHPEWMSLSVGTILTMLVNVLKVRYGVRVP